MLFLLRICSFFSAPFHIVITPTSDNVIKHKNKTISCILIGHDATLTNVLTWYKFQEGTPKILNTSTNTKYAGGSFSLPHLTITDFVESDDGDYFCKVGGISSCTSKLTCVSIDFVFGCSLCLEEV